MAKSKIIRNIIIGVALIVFGILLFNQVGNWNEARKTAKMKHEMMDKNYPGVQSEIKSLVDQFFEDGNQNNMEAMSVLHLDSPKFSRVEGNAILSYEEDRELEKAFYSDRKMLSYNISNHKVDVFEDMAISSSHIDLNTVAGEDTLVINAKASMVFVNYEGEWKLVHKHFSPRG